jgi:hypothetical protein
MRSEAAIMERADGTLTQRRSERVQGNRATAARAARDVQRAELAGPRPADAGEWRNAGWALRSAILPRHPYGAAGAPDGGCARRLRYGLMGLLGCSISTGAGRC